MTAPLPDVNWRELVKQIASDRVSGAAPLARETAHALLMFIRQANPADLAALHAGLLEIARCILGGQPSMAPVLRILNDVLLACTKAPALGEALEAVQDVCRTYESTLVQAGQHISEHVRTLLGSAARVVTISHSSVVARSLIDAHQSGLNLQVVCLESRPRFEGRTLATYLAEHGLRVEIAVDAAAYDVLSGADLWLVGADSLTEQGVVNKVGTALLAAAAREQGVLGYVLCDRSKLWPAVLGAPPIVAQDTAEVWPHAPAGVLVHNHYFDLTPWHLIAGVVDEEGVQPPHHVVRMCRGLAVDEALAAILSVHQ